MTDKLRARPFGSGSRPADQAPAGLVAPRFDPSRNALQRIAWLRPAGDVCGIRLKDAIRLIEEMERIALDALGEGL